MEASIEQEFTFEKRIEGAVVFTIDGTATITSMSGDPFDANWAVSGVRVDATIENPRRVPDQPRFIPCEVELPEGHPLRNEILIQILQSNTYFHGEVSRRWRSLARQGHEVPAL